ncbi:Os01g0328000 [Oryza sativa Japonica Group]|jgi:hypothetical protein|nr:Os01g0328000 [Oryza sativa Japonica Group]
MAAALTLPPSLATLWPVRPQRGHFGATIGDPPPSSPSPSRCVAVGAYGGGGAGCAPCFAVFSHQHKLFYSQPSPPRAKLRLVGRIDGRKEEAAHHSRRQPSLQKEAAAKPASAVEAPTKKQKLAMERKEIDQERHCQSTESGIAAAKFKLQT